MLFNLLYWKIKVRRLQKFCKDTRLPIQLKSGEWAMNTEHGLEIGSASYVAAELCGDNLVYTYSISDYEGHAHSFEEVIEALMNNPKDFTVKGSEEDYSAQELRVLHRLQKAYEVY